MQPDTIDTARALTKALIAAIWYGEGRLAFQVASGATQEELLVMAGLMAGQIVDFIRHVFHEQGVPEEEMTQAFQGFLADLDRAAPSL